MPRPLNAVPVGATFKNHNVSVWRAGYWYATPTKWPFDPQRGRHLQVENGCLPLFDGGVVVYVTKVWAQRPQFTSFMRPFLQDGVLGFHVTEWSR